MMWTACNNNQLKLELQTGTLQCNKNVCVVVNRRLILCVNSWRMC